MKKIILFCFISLLICSCKSNDTEITEKKVITQLSLSQTQAQLAQGDSLSLTLSYTPADLPAPTCTWTSSDTTVARVDNKGKIKTMGRGMATITAATVKTNVSSLVISAQCKLTVTYKGDGSTSNPYLIYTVADLKAIRDSINTKNDVYGNKAYKLMNDLDFSKDTASWIPIGNSSSTTFKGCFDGNDKSIKNIHMKTSSFSINYIGLFGCVSNSNIKNLGIQWGAINVLSSKYSGGVGGQILNSTISNCYSTGNISDGDPTGGIGGEIIGSTILNSYSTGNMYRTGWFGGGIGGRVTNSTIINCYSTGDVYGYLIGGISGSAEGSSSIINCYSSGNIIANWGNACGIVANIDTATVTNCIALNSGLTSNTNAAIGRIGIFWGNSKTSNNYASTSIIVKQGTIIITTFRRSRDNGSDLTAQPVDLLNAYVSANPTFNNIGLKKWKVTAGVNNGYPVFE